MMPEEYETNVSTIVGTRDGEIIKVVCPICTTKTNHTILVSVHQDWEVVDVIDGSYDMLTLQCNGCESLQFYKESRDDMSWRDEVVNGQHQEVPDIKKEVFPIFNTDFKPLRHYSEIPKHVKDLYKETYNSLISGDVYLSGAGVRAIIEAICSAHDISSGNLFSKINQLYTKGVVTEAMKDLLHSVRVFGNQSIHTDTSIDYRDLVLAWDAIDYLMVSIYGTGSVNSQYEWKKSRIEVAKSKKTEGTTKRK